MIAMPRRPAPGARPAASRTLPLVALVHTVQVLLRPVVPARGGRHFLDQLSRMVPQQLQVRADVPKVVEPRGLGLTGLYDPVLAAGGRCCAENGSAGGLASRICDELQGRFPAVPRAHRHAARTTCPVLLVWPAAAAHGRREVAGRWVYPHFAPAKKLDSGQRWRGGEVAIPHVLPSTCSDFARQAITVPDSVSVPGCRAPPVARWRPN